MNFLSHLWFQDWSMLDYASNARKEPLELQELILEDDKADISSYQATCAGLRHVLCVFLYR